MSAETIKVKQDIKSTKTYLLVLPESDESNAAGTFPVSGVPVVSRTILPTSTEVVLTAEVGSGKIPIPVNELIVGESKEDVGAEEELEVDVGVREIVVAGVGEDEDWEVAVRVWDVGDC